MTQFNDYSEMSFTSPETDILPVLEAKPFMLGGIELTPEGEIRARAASLFLGGSIAGHAVVDHPGDKLIDVYFVTTTRSKVSRMLGHLLHSVHADEANTSIVAHER